MDIVSIKTIMAEINSFIQQQMWLDFEVIQYIRNKLTVIGSIDISNPHDLEIHFEDISFVSLPIEWKTDTSKTALLLLEGEAAILLNKRFHVQQGYHIFKFTPEDYPEDFGCYVGARAISYQIIKH
ncbi:hypothetical protein [Acetonema longum]|uniref:Uncharacterized protein n=1 Tax=Acetonema longum DSM 6540 TaxID=1009370 RepID=F7NMI0_9FIRM|nr:hypothetical protein [Acetonema longum]EGO62751.1 hypothetical protein ALO_16552 [Acetonema longum DSM 6540]